MDKVEEARNPMTGSMKSSYQNWNSAKLIVRHTKPVSEEIVGSRSRNIQKIFVETIEGERFKFPVNHLAGARAMARHVGAGGTFYDKVGQHIINLSEEFKGMQRISTHIYRNKSSLNEDAYSIRDAVRVRINEVRKELNRFMTISGYAQKVEEVETAESEPLNEESIEEAVTGLKTLLQVDETDTSLINALPRAARFFEKKSIDEDLSEDTDSGLVDLIKKAYSSDRGGDDISVDEPKENELVDAARLFANPREIEFLPANPKHAKMKAEYGEKMTPIQNLAWRISAISERMKPSSSGALILSAILSRISEKINNAIEDNGPSAKVKVNPAQKAIIQMFIKDVAPMIGESITEAGYTDWELDEVAPLGHGDGYPDTELLKKKFTKDKEKELVKKGVSILKPKKDDGVTYKEAQEISEWFENFDPLRIIKESAKEEAEVEEGTEDEIEEQHEEITESNVLNKDEAWWIADFLVRGEATPADIVNCYEGADRKVIAEVLNENWTTETTEAIIKELALEESELKSFTVKFKKKGKESSVIIKARNKDEAKAKVRSSKKPDFINSVTEACTKSDTLKKKKKITEYSHTKDEDVFIWFADEESFEKAKQLLIKTGDSFTEHNNEVDHGIEFKGPRVRAAFEIRFAKDPGIRIVAGPELGPYTPSRNKPKNRVNDHPDFDKNHKDAIRSRLNKAHSVVDRKKNLLDGEEKTLGGDIVKNFKHDVESAKERVRKNRPPFTKSRRAKEIEKSKKEINAIKYK